MWRKSPQSRLLWPFRGLSLVTWNKDVIADWEEGVPCHLSHPSLCFSVVECRLSYCCGLCYCFPRCVDPVTLRWCLRWDASAVKSQESLFFSTSVLSLSYLLPCLLCPKSLSQNSNTCALRQSLKTHARVCAHTHTHKVFRNDIELPDKT